MKRKGMSQVLALIVAAMVLMMTALTVIFMAQGSLGDFGENTRSASCISQIETQCQVKGVTTVDTPGSCVTDGQATNSYRNSNHYNSIDTASCPSNQAEQ